MVVDQSSRAPAATVFLDVSGSMAGYVARPATVPPARPVARGAQPQRVSPPRAPEPRAFYDVVQSLPQLASSVADRLALFAFGKTIRPMPLADLNRAGTPAFYSDPDSRIQDALSRLEALPTDEIGLLVTDLFLTGEEVFGGAAAIRAPLAKILESGRSIGLVGIRSGFLGKVYDIPVVGTYAGASERPFFIVATGPLPIVSRLIRRMQTELLDPLPPPQDGEPRYHSTIFTHSPLTGGPSALPLRPEGKAEAAPGLAPDAGDIARIRFPGGTGSATAPLDLQNLSQPSVLLPNRFSIAEEVWVQPPGTTATTACDKRWLAVHSLPRLAKEEEEKAGMPVIRVGPDGLNRVTPGLTFLLNARLTAEGLSDNPAQTAWVRAWNLEPREAEAYVASKPSMFRTLNLREIVSMLEGLVRDKMTPRPVGQAIMAFQVPGR